MVILVLLCPFIPCNYQIYCCHYIPISLGPFTSIFLYICICRFGVAILCDRNQTKVLPGAELAEIGQFHGIVS